MPKLAASDRSAFSASDPEWTEAVRREAVIRPLSASAQRGRGSVKAAAGALSLSEARIYALLRRFHDHPVTASLLPHRPGPVKGARFLPAAVEIQIQTVIDQLFLRPERPTVAKVWAETRRACHLAGLQPPSLKALRARISARTLRERVKARDGAETAGNRFRQVRTGLRTERRLQVVQIDHTKVDIMLVDDVTRACIGRPWLTLVLDVHTRMVTGFHLSLDAPSATAAALAMAQAVLPKASWLKHREIELAWPVSGLPEIIHVDNGSEFHSRAFERGCQQHGIRIEYRPPATPRFGGHIERLMGTLMGRVHALPGSTSSNSVARGSYDPEARAILSFQEFERILALEVLGPYHNDIHSALGRTPASAWLAEAEVTVRAPADAAALVHDFLPFEERLVRRDGVRLFGIIYQDGALAHLVDHGAGKLRVKYDPRNLSAVFVELPGGDHVRVPYADIRRQPITLWEHREAVQRLRQEGHRSVDEHAIFTSITEQRRVLVEAQSRSKAARRAVARIDHAERASASVDQGQAVPGRDNHDGDATVPMPLEGETSGVEFW